MTFKWRFSTKVSLETSVWSWSKSRNFHGISRWFLTILTDIFRVIESTCPRRALLCSSIKRGVCCVLRVDWVRWTWLLFDPVGAGTPTE
jgi:hypothetical protein